MKEQLDADGRQSVPVTSGSKGIHIYVRWRASDQSQTTAEYAKALADSAVQAFPRLATASMSKIERGGKVLIDWSQNNPSKTTVTVYSLRARDTPTVSTPVTWEEVENCSRASDLVFTTDEVLDRVSELGDLFAPLL